MAACNLTLIMDVFSMDENECVEGSLKVYVVSSIGVIGLLLLALLVLIGALCCMAFKLWKIKRY